MLLSCLDRSSQVKVCTSDSFVFILSAWMTHRSLRFPILQTEFVSACLPHAAKPVSLSLWAHPARHLAVTPKRHSDLSFSPSQSTCENSFPILSGHLCLSHDAPPDCTAMALWALPVPSRVISMLRPKQPPTTPVQASHVPLLLGHSPDSRCCPLFPSSLSAPSVEPQPH